MRIEKIIAYRDRIEIHAEKGMTASGVCYVTDMDAEVSRGNSPLIPKGKPIGTWVTCPGEECIRSLSGAARQTAI